MSKLTTGARAAAVTTATAALAGGLLAGVLAGDASAAPADRYETVGGVNMQAACNNQYPGQGRVAQAMSSSDALSWRCKRTYKDDRGYPSVVYYNGINVKAQCVAQYGGNVYAAASSQSNAYSWYCYRIIVT